MKSLLRTVTVAIILTTILCVNANATVTLENNVLTFTGENFNNFGSIGYTSNYSDSMYPHSESWSFDNSSLTCITGENWHSCTNTGYYRRSISEPRIYFPRFIVNGTDYLADLSGALGSTSSKRIYYTYPTNYTSTVVYQAQCDRCSRVVTFNSPPSVYNWDKSTTTGSKYVYSFSGTTNYTSVILKNCTSPGTYPSTSSSSAKTFTLSSRPTTVNGGNYTGQPAFNSSNVTIVKGTITDTNSTTSTFLLGEDSEATVTTSGTKTV